MDIEIKKDLASNWFKLLQNAICDDISRLEKNKIKFAGLDVFEKEPNPEIQLLMNPELSLTPHLGAATIEAQDRIGTELASQIIKLLKE